MKLKQLAASAAIIATLTGASVFLFTKEEPLPEEKFNYIFLESDNSYQGAYCKNCLLTPEANRTLIQVTEKEVELFSKGYDAEFVNEKLVVTKGERATKQEDAEIEQFNNQIYKQISDTYEIKKGKIIAEEDYSKEDLKINKLKSKLK